MNPHQTHFDPELLADLEAGNDREQQLVELVRLDYDSALRAMSGFVTSGAQIRAIGVAAWGVVLGLAVSNESVALALLAAALTVLFSAADAYHAALYRRALARAITVEGLLDAYLDRLGIDADDPEAILRTRAKLETHRFGMHRALGPPKAKDLVRARPHAVFRAVYPALLAVAIIATLVYAL